MDQFILHSNKKSFRDYWVANNRCRFSP